MKIDLSPQFRAMKSGEPPKLRIFYYTDPDCSWCWACEPAIKKIKEEYGDQISLVYKMGGLLEKWDTFFDASNQINRPEQVAPHWIEVAEKSGMPIDENIWFEDPPTSTYPACIAFRAAFLQDPGEAEKYLRRLREAVLTEKRNISRENILFELAKEVGFDMDKFREDFLVGPAQTAFHEDLQEARGRGISGFPTLVIRNNVGQEITLAGFHPYTDYEDTMKHLASGTLFKMPLMPIVDFINKYKHVATQEVAGVYELDREASLAKLTELLDAGKISKEEKAGGEFWRPA